MIKQLIKEKCLEALDYFFDNSLIEDFASPTDLKNYYVLEQLINEHFDNPPLKFEELKVGMWVWDNKDKEWCKYISYQTFEYLDGYGSEFEENRFYRYEVK